MATLSAADLAALAETLTSTIADVEKTSRNIQQHIDAKAKEIGDARGRTYAKAADERIKAVTDEAAIEIRRRDDVIEELRIQIAHLEQRAHAWFALEKRVREVVNVANQRGEGVPAQVLLQAIAEAQSAGRQDPNQTVPAHIGKEG